MLIRYEYQLLSYISSKGIPKVNGDVVVPLNRIADEVSEDDNQYFNYLDNNDLIDMEIDKIIIHVDKWSDFFVENLKGVLKKNNYNIDCKLKKDRKNNITNIYIEFTANGTSKEFLLRFDNKIDIINIDCIFMCIPNVYSENLYWMELINNINVLRQFYFYIVNEMNNINRTAYREINLFDGLDEKYISHIFNFSIKDYLLENKFAIREYDKDEYSFIKNIYLKKDISFYGMEKDEEVLWLIKDDKKIVFISTRRDKQITYSEYMESIIGSLEDKISKKIEDFNKIKLFIDNSVLDMTVKSIKEATTILVPSSLIFSILSLLNSNFKIKLGSIYKPILIIIIVVLIIIQGYLLKAIYWPIIRSSRFNWKL